MTNNPPPATLEDFNRLVAERLQQQTEADQRERYSGLPEDARLWMALAPGWTVPLAEACGFPGAGPGKTQTLFERMQAAGLVEVFPASIRPDGSPTPAYYVMNSAGRSEILSAYVAGAGEGAGRRSSPQQTGLGRVLQNVAKSYARQSGPSPLRQVLSKIGGRVSKVMASLPDAPPPVARWAALAERAASGEAMSDLFDARIDAAFYARDSGELLNWIEAARPLAYPLARDLDPAMNIALQRAGRRLELLHRPDYDRQLLAHFYRRDEQVAAFQALMDGPDDLWALHFIGAGGVGKTMFIRYVTADLAANAKRGADDGLAVVFEAPSTRDIAVARIDFDYLNADYPSLAPGLLLWSFAQELRLYDHRTGLATKYFDEGDRVLRRLHQRLGAGDVADPRPTATPEFREAVALYVNAFKSLRQRVLLIVDTCEELAKVSLDGGPSENVNETFRILRALHDGPRTLADENVPPEGGLPSLRVIFSGRRPLARRGHRWSCAASALAPRSYLRLHEIRGFTHADAFRFLRDEQVPEGLIAPIVQSSTPDAGSVVKIDWDDPADAPAEIDRCNPYQLRLYLDWAKEVKPPTPDEITQARGGNQYVELRILRRLGYEPLQDTLPAVALLGHFDRETLQAASGLDDDTFAAVWDKLQQQEWVDHRYVTVEGSDQPCFVLDVEKGVRDRLTTYYEQRGSDLDAARARAADYLERATPDRPLAALDWSYFDAALRVFEPSLERAAAWWEAVEARMFSERQTKWMLDTLGFLTGPDGAVALRDDPADKNVARENPLRPLVLATYAAALLHSDSRARTTEVWGEVERKARAYPDSEAYRRLWFRAVAGMIAATRFTQAAPDPQAVSALWRAIAVVGNTLVGQAVETGGLLAAAEAVVEHAERLAITDPVGARALLTIPAAKPDAQPTLGPGHLSAYYLMLYTAWEKREGKDSPRVGAASLLVAFAFSLTARAQLVVGLRDKVRPSLSASLKSSDLSRIAQLVWPDWLPPDDLAARLRLEFARGVYPALMPAGQALATASANPELNSIDGDHFYSALLRLRLALGPVPLDELLPLGWASKTDSSAVRPIYRETDLVRGPSTCNAHRLTPPLFVAVAEVYAAGGWVDEALRQLRYVVDQASRFDLESVRHADRALLRLVLRMRLGDEGQTAGQSLSDSSAWEDQRLVWASSAFGTGRLWPELTGEAAIPLAALHALWQVQSEAGQALKFARDYLQPRWDPSLSTEESDFWQASVAVDLIEYVLLQANVLNTVAWPSPGEVYRRLDSRAWWQAHPDQPEAALTLFLRMLALGHIGNGRQAVEVDALIAAVWEGYANPEEGEVGIPADLLAHIGSRRAAEIALTEGELLALRLPRQAIFILERAEEWFRACHDDAGEFTAGVSFILTSARQPPDSTSETTLNAKLAGLRLPYLRLREGRELPAWESLEQIAALPTGAALDALGPRVWRPWLMRLVLCMVAIRRIRSPSQPPATAELQTWLEKNYGAQADGRVLLPAEFRGWFEPSVKAPPPPQADNSLRTYLIVGLVSVAGLLVGGFYLFRWLAGYILAVNQWNTGWQVAAYCGLIAALVALFSLSPTLTRGVRAWWASLARLVLRIDPAQAAPNKLQVAVNPPADRSAGDGLSVKIKLTRLWPALTWPWRTWPPYVLRPLKDLPEFSRQWAGLLPYQVLASDLSDVARAELKRLRGLLGSRWLEVEILPGEGLHGPCWEVIIALSMRDEKTASPRSLPFRFRRAALGKSRPLAWPRPTNVVSLAVGPEAAEVASRGWSPLSGDSRFSFSQSGLESWLAPASFAISASNRVGVSRSNVEDRGAPGPVHILHLVGSVEETSAGLRLRLTRGVPVSESMETVERLLRADEVTSRYPDLQLCVLQGNPAEFSPQRLEGDRRAANLARAFAAELSAHGAPMVVVIPPLEPRKAAQVLGVLAKAVRRRPSGAAREWRQAVAHAQDAVVAGFPGDAEAAWEAALDVCWYAA